MLSRYDGDLPIRQGKIRRTATAVGNIRRAQRAGRLPTREIILKQGERLDHIAGQEFGNSTLWWVIAATSNIGWGLQAPPGTIIKIPLDIDSVLGFI